MIFLRYEIWLLTFHVAKLIILGRFFRKTVSYDFRHVCEKNFTTLAVIGESNAEKMKVNIS